MIAAYLVWLAAASFSGLCALTLIAFIRSLDPPDIKSAPTSSTIEKHAA